MSQQTIDSPMQQLLELRNSLRELALAFRSAKNERVADALFVLADDAQKIRHAFEAAWQRTEATPDPVQAAIERIQARTHRALIEPHKGNKRYVRLPRPLGDPDGNEHDDANNPDIDDEPSLLCPHCGQDTGLHLDKSSVSTLVGCPKCGKSSRVDHDFENMNQQAVWLVPNK